MKKEDQAAEALSQCSISTVKSEAGEEDHNCDKFSFCSDLEKTENSILHILDDLESDKGKNKS